MPVLMIISIGSSLCRQDSVATSMETVQKAQLWQPCVLCGMRFPSIRFLEWCTQYPVVAKICSFT